jgi:hypothetical protein
VALLVVSKLWGISLANRSTEFRRHSLVKWCPIKVCASLLAFLPYPIQLVWTSLHFTVAVRHATQRQTDLRPLNHIDFAFRPTRTSWHLSCSVIHTIVLQMARNCQGAAGEAALPSCYTNTNSGIKLYKVRVRGYSTISFIPNITSKHRIYSTIIKSNVSNFARITLPYRHKFARCFAQTTLKFTPRLPMSHSDMPLRARNLPPTPQATR